jgi:Cu(I)/Ag(I) efflux system membrane fusion protein
MKKRSLPIFIISAIIVTLIIGIVIGRYSGHSTSTEKKPSYWVDSMEPTIHYPGPGQSRMGMELTPVYPEEGQGTDETTVRISPTLVNNLGVRIVPVVQGTLSKRIEAVGYVEPNENKISHIHTYADGWVKKLFVKAVGEVVKEDQVVLQLYSPILVSAQEEYLIALGSGDKSLMDASIKKMQTLHIPEQQIQQLKTTRKSSQLIDIYPHQNGVLTALSVREGMHVTPDTEMMSIVDLSSIWMIAEIYESQANWVKVAQSAEARLSSVPGKVWKGEVEYIYPQVDPTTRTLKVRFRFANPDGILKPNMYANINIFAEPKLNVLSISLEALIRNSEGDRVIVSLGNGRFQARPVTIGIESGNSVEILSGLKVGEMVVASGQFLIDSEANLKAGLEQLDTSIKTTDTQQTATEAEKIIEGKGIIKVLNVSQHTVTLQHEPIPALNWPVMTMDFTVDKKIEIKNFKVGDHVKFILKSTTENQFITEMNKLP